MQEILADKQKSPIPKLIAETEGDAIAIVNRWLHRDVGMALNVSSATFHPETFCWHLPIYLAYGATGPQGVVGDVYLHAATGEFVGVPEIEDLQQRADALAIAHGITE